MGFVNLQLKKGCIMKIISFYANPRISTPTSFKGGISSSANDVKQLIEKEFGEYLRTQQSQSNVRKLQAQELVGVFNKVCAKYGEQASMYWDVFKKSLGL